MASRTLRGFVDVFSGEVALSTTDLKSPKTLYALTINYFPQRPKDGAESILLHKCPQSPLLLLNKALSAPSFDHYLKQPIGSAHCFEITNIWLKK